MRQEYANKDAKASERSRNSNQFDSTRQLRAPTLIYFRTNVEERDWSCANKTELDQNLDLKEFYDTLETQNLEIRFKLEGRSKKTWPNQDLRFNISFEQNLWPSVSHLSRQAGEEVRRWITNVPIEREKV